MSSSNEGSELKLISSIRYKFAGVSGDEKKLSQALQSHLTSLLEKAGSQHKVVRDAAFQAFISVNNFVKPAGVNIPVAALIKQYKQTESNMVKQLDLNLIKQGIMRLDQSKRRELLPVALHNISKEPTQASGAGFFNIFLRLLLEIKAPGRGSSEDMAFRETVGLQNASDAQYVATWLGKLFLLKQDLALVADDELPNKLSIVPSGLAKEDVSFLRSNNPQLWNPDAPNSLSLPECKRKAVDFLASGAFNDEERYLPAICASGSPDSRITSVADDVIKRANVDLESENLVRSLYAAHDSLPTAHRIQILKLLSKSGTACVLKKQVVGAVKMDFSLTAGENSPINGLEALRLHKALLAFLAWVSRNTYDSNIGDSEMAPALIIILKDYILQQGWPTPNVLANKDEQRLRANAYEVIGTLARSSQLEEKVKASMLKWLLDSLVSDPSTDIVVHIESALSSMMSLFKSNNASQHRDLEVLLLEYMTLPEREGIRTARHVVTRFANHCLPFSNVKARWISVLAVAGGSSERRDVLEEGQRGLDPWWATKLQPDETALRLPSWTQLSEYFFDSTPRQLGEHDMSIDQTSKYKLFPDNRISAFPVSVRLVKNMLLLTARGTHTFEIDWENRLDTQLQNDLGARRSIKHYFKHVDPASIIQILHAAFDGLRDHPEIGPEECLSCIADILSFAPLSIIASTICNRAPELLTLTKSNNYKVRQLVAKAFGTLAPFHDQAAGYTVQVHRFVESCDNRAAAMSAQYQCSLSCLASYHATSAIHGRLPLHQVSNEVQSVYKLCVANIENNDTAIQNTALDSLAQLWTVGIGLPPDEDEWNLLVASLTKLALKGNEKSIYALGRLALSTRRTTLTDGDARLKKILENLLALTEIKRTEVHFVIGEAISAAIACWDSESVQLSVDVELSESTDNIDIPRKRPEHIFATLDKLIEGSKATKPSLIKASGIWLFCIIQFCSNLNEIQSRLRECQVAFMRLLTARDELVQETASRGLALAYEKGDDSLKGDLVRDLVASFTGAKMQLKVDEETELFDAGALPTGEGKSITSYKDIINLANEVGDQRLIYKFMALATNAATWTARSAFGRFGLSNILSDADLDPKIFPKLYRYRFDPNPNVRRSMDDIWKAVAKDQTATIDQHFDAIMTDLLRSIVDGREWRVRQASCAAIADLIYGQPFPKYDKYYVDIWKVTLRVLDDQKGSVREAALKLCLGLSKTLVTQLQENNHSSSAQAMMNQVFPFLLSDKGIENSVEDVKIMAIKTVLDVVKSGGEAMKPFIPTIITHFLGLLSTIEPSQINYYYQRVSEEDREGLDKLRSSAATRSPMFECIVNCLPFVDNDVMSKLAPQLVSTIKSALGMQTKIGCSELLSTMALRHSLLLSPYKATFLKSLQTQIFDRNNEVSKAYARSAAYLLRSSSPKARESYSTCLIEAYFKPVDDDTPRQKVADAILAIAKISPDAFSDLEFRLLPFSYYAKHDTDSYVSEEFDAVWNQHAGGSHTVKRYTDEIVGFISEGLSISKWSLQHGAAFTVASMITALSGAINESDQFNEPSILRIWPVLDRALSLKTFRGKEKLIAAYPLFIKHSKAFWAADSTVSAHTKKIATREAKRNNDEYRPSSIEALADFAAVRDDLDMYAEVVSIVSEYLRPEGETHNISDLKRKTSESSLKAVMTAYSQTKMQSSPVTILNEIAATVEGATEATSLNRDTFFKCTLRLMQRASESEASSGDDHASLATRWFKLLLRNEGEVVVESHRASRAKALEAFARAWRTGTFCPREKRVTLEDEMVQKVKSMMEIERSLDVQRLLTNVVTALQE
ncbi:proteasome component ECM29 [Xylariaceae sp. FL1272]|nr:proteasome component ECM29 [Xylariaceae sp. FL1272]